MAIKRLVAKKQVVISLAILALLGGVTIAQRTELRRSATAGMARTPSTPGAGANDIYRFNPNVTAGGNWKEHLDWSISDIGAPDCPDLYIVTCPECLAHGNRSCVMRTAIASAKAGDFANAFRLALVSECHNTGAQMDLAIAGPQAVCDYLRAK